MIRRRPPFALATAMLALAAPMLASMAPPQVVGHVTIHERIVIRVPSARRAPAPRPPTWVERKGPKCLAIEGIAAAAIVAPAAVDLLLVDGRRVRARLEHDCRSADFYSGLYIRPGPDGRICADRDAIRVRSGAVCEIDDFRLLAMR